MLHLIEALVPRPLHRAAYRLAHTLRKRWWRWRKPLLIGCRVLVLDREGRLLLIRHSYGTRCWMPPGGGVGRGEAPLTAAVRELREETGCRLEDAHEVVRLEELLHGARNVVHIVAGWTNDTPVANGREVIAAAFFMPGALPQDMPNYLLRGVPEWLRAAKAAGLAPPPHRPAHSPARTE